MIGSRARVLLAAALVAGGAVATAPAHAETVWGGKACNFNTQQDSRFTDQFSGTLQVGPVLAPATDSVVIRCQIVGTAGEILADSGPFQVGQAQTVVKPISYSRQPTGLTRLRTTVTITDLTGTTTYDPTQPNCTLGGVTDTTHQNFITITTIGGTTYGVVDPGCF